MVEVNHKRFFMVSGIFKSSNQIKSPMATKFFIIASIGVIGNKLPKQPQFPEFPPVLKVS